MLEILGIFSQKDLETFFNAHPLRKKLILFSMKKSGIALKGIFYIFFAENNHKNFWVTEKNLIPFHYYDKSGFFFIVDECPICHGEHILEK